MPKISKLECKATTHCVKRLRKSRLIRPEISVRCKPLHWTALDVQPVPLLRLCFYECRSESRAKSSPLNKNLPYKRAFHAPPTPAPHPPHPIHLTPPTSSYPHTHSDNHPPPITRHPAPRHPDPTVPAHPGACKHAEFDKHALLPTRKKWHLNWTEVKVLQAQWQLLKYPDLVHMHPAA